MGVTGFRPTLSSNPRPRANSMCWKRNSLKLLHPVGPDDTDDDLDSNPVCEERLLVW
jgi:hypothetical protein